MSHHLETSCAYSVDNLGTFLDVSDLEFLLEEDGRLLVRRLDDASYEGMIRRRRRRMEEREKVDGLGKETKRI